MEKIKTYIEEKQTRLATVLTDFTRDPDAVGFIVSNMKIQYECIPGFENPNDVVLVVSFLGTMNLNGAKACEKHTDDMRSLPFPPNIPSEMAAYCAMNLLDHFVTVYGTLDQDCKRQWKDLAKESSDSKRVKSNFIKSEYSTHIVLKEEEK